VGSATSAGGFPVFPGSELFSLKDPQGRNNLWVIDGATGIATELTVNGASPTYGLSPAGVTGFNGEFLFSGVNSQGDQGLWISNGTAAGTTEIQVNVAGTGYGPGLSPFQGLQPSGFTVLGDKVLFSGLDSRGLTGLWVTDGTSTGTVELNVSGANTAVGLGPDGFQVVGDQAFFTGLSTGDHPRSLGGGPPGSYSLWVTDGTANGTTEIGATNTDALSETAYDVAAIPAGAAAVACFAAGTCIETPRGPVPIECLREGDTVLTVSGLYQPIRWIGRRGLNCRRHPAPERVQPVRIAAHAFGQSKPARALMLSPDHSVFVEDVFIPIRFLINGTTVRQVDVARITYYHLELPRHDVVLAEGLPAETYLETGGRGAFENGGTAIRLYPEFAQDEARVGQVWKNFGYAPLIGTDGEYDRVVARLAVQARMLHERSNDGGQRGNNGLVPTINRA
jgi:hypothetical protein